MALIERNNNEAAPAPAKVVPFKSKAIPTRDGKAFTRTMGCLFMISAGILLWILNTLATINLARGFGLNIDSWVWLLQFGMTCAEIAFFPFKRDDVNALEVISWAVIVLLDVGSSFASFGLYLQGKHVPLFGTLTFTAWDWPLLLACAVWSFVAAFGPEPTIRHYLLKMLSTWGV